MVLGEKLKVEVRLGLFGVSVSARTGRRHIDNCTKASCF